MHALGQAIALDLHKVAQTLHRRPLAQRWHPRKQVDGRRLRETRPPLNGRCQHGPRPGEDLLPSAYRRFVTRGCHGPSLSLPADSQPSRSTRLLGASARVMPGILATCGSACHPRHRVTDTESIQLAYGWAIGAMSGIVVRAVM